MVGAQKSPMGTSGSTGGGLGDDENSVIGARGATAVFDGCGELIFDVPREMDPLVLLKFLHAGIDDGSTGRFSVEGGEVGFGQMLANDFGGLARIDEVVKKISNKAVQQNPPSGGAGGEASGRERV